MAKLLWQPSEAQIKRTNMYRFMNIVNEKYNQNFDAYAPLYEWSVANIPDFWASMWEFADIIASEPYDRVIDDVTKMPGAEWFSGARLNFAENLLRYRDDRTALIFKGEGQASTRITYAELYDEVARLARRSEAFGRRSRRPGGGVYAEYAGDHDRHAGGNQPGRRLVLLLAGFRHQGGAGSVRANQTQDLVYRQRLFFQGQKH